MTGAQKTTRMVQLALLIAIELLLAFTPLGFIPLGAINATTVHIPVIIGAILLGPAAGALLGGVFGLCSIINNTIKPTITSFVFSPFYTAGGVSGGWRSLVVALLPRVLIGVVAAYTFRLFGRRNKNVGCIAAGLAGSLTNTVLVLSGIYLLFGSQYAAAKGIAIETLFKVLMGVVAANGLPEAVVAALLSTAIAIPLQQVVNRR